jgi:hypothetical protein
MTNEQLAAQVAGLQGRVAFLESLLVAIMSAYNSLKDGYA